jgi:SAM-dependent methyltransferase
MTRDAELRAAEDDRAFTAWLQALEARHMADLTFAEVSRALRALSATYVERRRRLTEGAALAGAGKRAAFALFYGPLHFLFVREVVRALPRADAARPTLVDLGCGTGAAGAAWALACHERPKIVGVDRHPWALAEAARTYRAFGLTARTRRADVAGVRLPGGSSMVLAAYAVNEMADRTRDGLLARIIRRIPAGDSVLVVEPLAGFVARWWDKWRAVFEQAGGRADQWRFRRELPPLVARLDAASGLDHRELTGRSLWLPGPIGIDRPAAA